MSAIFDWAKGENLQPEPITVEIWKQLPEEFCRQVEVLNGEAIRAESPSREHQKAARRLADMIESAAEEHMRRHDGSCLDVSSDFDVLLWQFPSATIRRPDVALFECAPPDERPLRVHRVKLAVEVVSPGSEKTDTADKKAEYALAGIPWYWLVWVADNQVTSIEVHVLDHAFDQYRPHVVLEPVSDRTTIDVPIRVHIDWRRLAELSR
ncbi:Uma2 family endonuclease [Actinomadura barringtoniae]|uniref:Uma2 family endonuclease n=1 Tax=Actinomadura barringtoniae TaxID=1427535 RepID=A0A939P7H1_9ACTN|nr:Uma2 family endonuclease [Actinomadura barringtoniae]MBO2446507.1 Uma2 family endonuclease [Actinomadura barringtoniae]